MDPYRPPAVEEAPPEVKAEVENVHRGSHCIQCGSLNTSGGSILRPSTSILGALFFGWIYILFRTAFRVNKEVCYDCGAIRRYRTTGSWVAMIFLILIIGMLVLRYLS